MRPVAFTRQPLLCGTLPETVTEDEALSLFAKARAGDEGARERLINGNLRLVWAMVLRYARPGVELEDLFQTGCMGLIRAIDDFDPSRGTRLATYAVPLILGKIRHYLRSLTPVRVSKDAMRSARKVAETADRLRSSLCREPTLAEVAGAAGLAPEEVAFVVARVAPALEPPAAASWDAEADGRCHELPGLSPGAPGDDRPDSQESIVDNLVMRDALASLDPRLQTIVLMRFMRGLTQAEVAGRLSLSQPQVSRLERQALHELRLALGSTADDGNRPLTETGSSRPY